MVFVKLLSSFFVLRHSPLSNVWVRVLRMRSGGFPFSELGIQGSESLRGIARFVFAKRSDTSERDTKSRPTCGDVVFWSS